ncbi:DUF669 domain-containing protein [Hyphomicrobium sp.]|uniref:DUF669 domain-containing protein n=1 Tax=Hyphomicrobium sp. TaxID=82 RepID=UPI0025BCB50A|nr:DUF669 domain-containing protein [Hyphomicrobium sp.]MCC7253833.1 DUF669 domain-containing protein [Hyphomicrobium sp.]
MAELNQAFDPNEVPEDDRSFEPLPAGDYQMQVIESKIENTKSLTGKMLVLTLEVVSGPHTNRRVWDRLNIVNQNADAQRIAQRALADLCLAVGIAQLRDTDELHFKPFVGRVGVREDKTGQYGPQNTVRYKARGGQPPAGKAGGPTSAGSAAGQQTRTAPASATARPSAPAASPSRPWAKAS